MKAILLTLILATTIQAPTNPIPITGEHAARVREAYSAIVAANKDLQIAILQARYDLNVPKDWGVNLEKLQFEPPRKP
jgi:hypothetical protein